MAEAKIWAFPVTEFPVQESFQPQEGEELAEVLEFRSAHDRLWDTLGPEDAPMVREALVHADELRQGDTGAGDDYLRYFTDRLAS